MTYARRRKADEKKAVKPDRICFECLHYEACQSWNIGSLVKTAADNCVNYRASVDIEPPTLDLEEMVSEAELCISTAELVLSDEEYKEFTERVTELL